MTSRNDCSSHDDRPGGSPEATSDVAGHIVVCSPCDVSLDALKGQGDALKYLSAAPEKETETAVIQRVLADSARAGRQRLADLLYELAKACLSLVEVPSHRVYAYRVGEKGGFARITSDISRVAARHREADPSSLSRQLPVIEPAAPHALDVTEKCVLILGGVEGPSSRQQMILIQICLFGQRFPEAEEICRGLLDESANSTFREMALINLSCVLNRQGKYDEAISVGEQAVSVSPRDFMAVFNLAMSLAATHQADRFKAVANRIGSLIDGEQASLKQEIVRHCLPAVSTYLECSQTELSKWFGLAEAASG